MRHKRILPLAAGLAVVLVLILGRQEAWAAFQKKAVKASSQEIALAGSLQKREAAVAAREKALAQKEEELAALKKQVDENLTRLIALQNELKAKLAELKSVKDKRFRNLIKVYSVMSPSKVAPLLNQMEDADALEILQALKTDQVAKIIPKLEQGKAVRLSKQLGLI